MNPIVDPHLLPRCAGLCRKHIFGLTCLCALLALEFVSCVNRPASQSPANVSFPELGPKGAVTVQQQEELIQWLASYAVAEQTKSGIPASITIAQAILETGWLKTDAPMRRRMIYEGKNLFGIKGRGTAGSVDILTHEVINGKTVPVMAKFRAYHSYGESFADHTHLLMNSGYYKGALRHRGNPRRYIREVAKNYATDPRYAGKIWSIVMRCNLTRFDTARATAPAR